MKKIVVYADGTWNTPANMDKNTLAPTNVYKMFTNTSDYYTDSAGNKTEQVKYYAEGVGTGLGADPISGGLFGKGINHNIVEVYRFIVEHYNDGDEIYLFGFSRGAYTVRSVAGMIRNCGILKKQYHQKIARAFEIYLSRDKKDKPQSEQSKFFRESFCHPKYIIKFIGVWDTVGSLGVPFKFFSWRDKFRFHDVELGSHVLNAYHAVSIDERRVFFRPSLLHKDKTHTHQYLEQVWFSGVHCDVGGGYKEYEASLIPMQYLQQKAEENQLHFKSTRAKEELETYSGAGTHNSKDTWYYKAFPDYFRVIDNQRKLKLSPKQQLGLWILRRIMKDVDWDWEKKLNKSLETCEYLHESVCRRYHKSPPENLPENLAHIFDSLKKNKKIMGFDGQLVNIIN